MSAGRFLVRAVSGLVALGVGLVVLIPVAAIIAAISIPVLIMFLVVAGVVGVAALLSVGLPTLIAGLLILVAIAAAVTLIGGAIGIGVFVLKVLLFAMLLAWLARKVFGWSSPRSSRSVLVGPPVADIAAPGQLRRDKYDIAAERELDEELGV